MSNPDGDLLCVSCFNELNSVGAVCPSCGYSESQVPLHQLKPRTILNGKYLVGKVLGEGGFGITYIGWDLNLYIKIAIKEYYPVGYVTRESTVVHPFTGSNGDFFRKGCDRFVEEARRLAKFRSKPGIVSVNDFFKENGTAYIVMEYIDGKTLKEYLEDKDKKLSPSQVFEIIKPVITSLIEVHKTGMIHRDISPDNIMISDNGELTLLDFGAAREFTESGSKSISIMLKPGYAPEEQYRSRGVQGPWTDIYALCATIYKCITGITPDESTDRVHSDEVKLPSSLGINIDTAQEAALMKGMAVLQKDRFQNLQEFYTALYEQPDNNTITVTDSEPKQDAQTKTIPALEPEPSPKIKSAPKAIKTKPENKKNKKKMYLFIAGIAAIAIVALAVILNLSAQKDDIRNFRIENNRIIDYTGPSGHVNIPPLVRIIGTRSFTDKGITRVTIPNGVTTIGERAFAGNKLTYIVLPNSVTAVGPWAFAGNPITRVQLGRNVNVHRSAIDDDFFNVYNRHNQIAGVYIYRNGEWIRQ